MVKAAVLGASGGIGQPLSLLLKACPLVDELALYDVVNTPGVAADLSHISSVAVCDNFLDPSTRVTKPSFLTRTCRKSPATFPRTMV
jgi:malate/lactate dehydrogenase